MSDRGKGATLNKALTTAGRLNALAATGLLDSPIDPSFDRITALVSRLLHVPVALVSLVDADRQFFKSSVGLPEPWASRRETPLTHSFCQHVVASGEPLIVTDARNDAVVSSNCAVTDLGVAAYLGVPLTTEAGHVLGSLCAIDIIAREWREEDVRLLRDMAGIVMREVVLHREIDQRKQAEDQLQLLIAELHHRVKNNMAVVQSLIELSLRHADNLEQFRRSISDRIASLAKSHSLLIKGQWSSVSLRAAILSEVEGYEQAGRVSLGGDEVMLPARTAVAIGMAAHELTTNAVKYGALSADDGRVDIRWSIVPRAQGHELLLDWSERNGPTVLPPTTRGFGSVLLERLLSDELNGKITRNFDPAGVSVRIEATLPEEPAGC
jgi:two-component sensor histidine kinase